MRGRERERSCVCVVYDAADRVEWNIHNKRERGGRREGESKCVCVSCDVADRGSV